MGELACPSDYRILFDVVSDLSHKYSISTVLELGASSGNFVYFLRERGFNAEGIDGDESRIKSWRADYLHHGELTALEDAFGDRTFDLIVARGVFCIGSQFDYSFSNRQDFGTIIKLRSTNPKFEEFIMGTLQKNIEEILKNAYRQLNPEGFFIVHEDVADGDCIDFSRNTAEGIGYVVKKFTLKEAILQKPLNK